MSNKESNQAVLAIKTYLDRRAAEDTQFADVYANPKKNINECFRYILQQAKKRGSAVCMTDEEVYGLAVHYYDEADLIVPANVGGASVSHSASPVQKVELTEAEKEAAREAARLKYEKECLMEFERKEAERKKKESERKKERQAAVEAKNYSPSLFDFE